MNLLMTLKKKISRLMASLNYAYDSLPPLKKIIDDYGLRAKKSLGQNFLLDLNLTGKVASTAGDISNINIIEIGSGPGGLTRAILMANAKKLYAFEKDTRCIAALQNIVDIAENKLELVEADALKIDLTDIVPEPRAIIANLPYNIATVLLLKWLKQSKNFEHMTLMFQKEVAMRICATPNTKAYGRLSIMVQWLCDVSLVFDIPASAFTPPPKVISSVVHFKPKQMPIDAPSFENMEKIVATAFGQRRKMLRKSLKPLLGDNVENILEQANIKPTDRAEDLSIDNYINLAKIIES